MDRNDPEFDKMHQTRRLIDRIRDAYKRLWFLRQFVIIDDNMVQYKGKYCLGRQYMPKNPIKWDLKIWCVGDTSSKYIYDFDVYCGRNLQTLEDVRLVAVERNWVTK